MKKYFALVMAIVMMASMSGAFALVCDGNWNWACPTDSYNCGKASIEIVEYVRQSTDCGTELVPNDCAVALGGERAYYAIKLTVPADINKDWYLSAYKYGVEVAYTNIATGSDLKAEKKTKDYFQLPTWSDVEGGGVFYLDATDTNAVTTSSTASQLKVDWDKAADFDADEHVFFQWVLRGCAKVCATIQADGGNALSYNVKGYTITISTLTDLDSKPATMTIAKGNKTVLLKLVGGEIDTATTSEAPSVVFNAYNEAAQEFIGQKISSGVSTSSNAGIGCAPGKFLYEALNTFGLNFGTCITKANWKANLGFKDTIKACSDYSSQGTAIVDVNCEIEIPKTGDVSVIAYAVMALVTAAGAVGLKK